MCGLAYRVFDGRRYVSVKICITLNLGIIFINFQYLGEKVRGGAAVFSLYEFRSKI